MPHRQTLGVRIRQLREERNWSQQQLAWKIPLSQKQLSRIEQSQVGVVDRLILIRIAEVLETPVKTGEVNQWLYSLGYRPYVRPLLPLPVNYRQLVEQFMPYPATLLDIGWYARWWNPAMERFYEVPNGSLSGIEANLFVQYFMPHGVMHRAYSDAHSGLILTRLLWEWLPYDREAWLEELKSELEAYMGTTMAQLRQQCQLDVLPLAPNLTVPVSLHLPRHRPLRFRSLMVPVAYRPDLKIAVYEPVDQRAEEWCRNHLHGPSPG